MTRTKKTVSFASAQNTSTADELLDSLVAFRPIETKTIETKIGDSEATICQIIVIDEDGQPTDLGERPIFWQVVRQQIAQASEAVPWIVGRLVKSGQAFRLDPLNEVDTVAARQGLLAATG